MAAKIKPDQLYEYGVLTRASESSGDVETNPVYPQNMRNWPRQVQGQYFIDKGVTTFEEYLATNPEHLDLNRILFFYEVERDGTKKRVHSGNLTHLPPSSTTVATPPQPSMPSPTMPGGFVGPSPYPISDAIKSPYPTEHHAPQPQWPYGQKSLNDMVRSSDFSEVNGTRQRILELQSENTELRSKINDRDAEINRLRSEVDAWRTKAFEAERRELNAMADLKVIQQTKEAELSAVRKEFESQMRFQEEKHRDSLEVMQIKAVNAAKQELSSLNDGNEEDFAEKLGDLLPKITPFLTPLIKLAEAGVDHLTRKWSTNGTPVALPSPMQQPMMQQPTQQQPVVDASAMPASQMPDYFDLPPGMPQ